MIILCNSAGIRTKMATAEEKRVMGVADSAILKANIASVNLIEAEKSSIGMDCVRLSIMEGNKYEITYQMVSSFNGLPVSSNQDLYEKTLEALGLNLTNTLL